MESARAIALLLRCSYGFAAGTTPAFEDLLMICADAGATVDLDWPLPGMVREVYAYGSIALQAGLSGSWRRWLLAHALGHHLMHGAGAHLYIGNACKGRYEHAREENDAERFAGTLLVGKVSPLTDRRAWLDVAHSADVPVACAMRWIDLEIGTRSA